MELANKELLKTAKKLESENLAKIKFTPERIVDLDRLLCDTYDRQCPKPVDYHNRRDLIRIFNVITKEIYGHNANSPVVKEYGSFVMDIFNERSDLDLSINLSNSIEVTRQKQKETLRKFSGKLRSLQRNGHVTGLQCILSAKVPIIKLTDCGTGIECDLSVNNRDGITKSHIIRAISAIDERFQKLSFLMKSWAKAHNINSSKDATLNSFSIISFVALHLQTCNPPILPPFSTLLGAAADPESVAEIVKSYINYGKQNKESLAVLFITLLVKLASVENLWQNGLCASLHEGSWISKSWTNSYSISVEDFTDQSQNVARAVGTNGFKMIYKCIHKSLNSISQFLNGQIGVEIMDHLFGAHALSTLGDPGTSNFRENKKNHPTLRNPRPSKKRRLVESVMHLRSGKTVQNSDDSNTPSVANQSQFVKPSSNIKVQTLQNSHASFTPSIPYQSMFDNPSTNTKLQTVQNSRASFTPSIPHQSLFHNPSTSTKVQPMQISHASFTPSTPHQSQFDNPSTSTKVQPMQISHASFTPSIPYQSKFDNPSTNTKVRSVQNSHASFTPSIPRQSQFDNPSTNTKVQTMQNSHASFTPLIPHQSQFDNPSINTKVRTVQNSHAFFTPSVPYQSPFDNPSTNIKVHHGYRSGHAPPPFGIGPIVFERSYNPSVQSHPILSQNSGGEQKTVASSPYHGSFPPSSLDRIDHAFYNQRRH